MLSRLEGMILLGGSVRRSPFAAAVARSLLDLPIEAGRTLLDQWHDESRNLARHLSREGLPVRLVLNENALAPAMLPSQDGVSMEVTRDRASFRGTGGLLHDIAADYTDDAVLLVANACQVLLRPLVNVVEEVASLEKDVNLQAHADGVPGSLFLLRCGVLRKIPPRGYVDFKEQALGVISKTHEVAVASLEEPSGLPASSLGKYLTALRAYHLARRGRPLEGSPYAENWEAAFSIVEDGARVEPGACLHDAVVLRGAHVRRGATVVRSVVCPGARVKARKGIVEEIVARRRVRFWGGGTK